jgi:hypothetical protein
MIILKSMTDLNQLNPSDPAITIIKKHFVRMAEFYPDSGYLILVEEGDTEKSLALPELKRPWADILWEGVSRLDDYFYAVYLTNNEFALEFLIPDAEWLDADLREGLEEHLI